MKQFSLTAIAALLYASASAQFIVNKTNPDYHPNLEKTKQFKRAHYFALDREVPDGVNPDAARWEQFKKSRANTLKDDQINATANWVSYGAKNFGGRLISHALDPNNDSIVWAGSANGGLWKSTDLGMHWEPYTDDLPSLAIGAIGINPKDPNQMLIGTGEGYGLSSEFVFGVGVLKSFDGGQTWVPTSISATLSSGFGSHKMVWHPTDTNIVNFASNSGIFHSTDGGMNWTTSLPLVGCDIIADPQSPDTLYACAQYYNSSLQGGLYRSTDKGATWTKLSTGLPPDGQIGFTSLTVHPTFTNVLYACIGEARNSPNIGQTRGVFKSSDYGITWRQLNTSVDVMCYQPPYQNVCQSWFANVIAVSPNDTNTVLAGGTRLWISTDGGTNWGLHDTVCNNARNRVHPDHHSIYWHPGSPNKIYLFTDGGFNYTSDGGLSWEERNTNLNTLQFYFITPTEAHNDLIIGGTQDNGVFSNWNAHADSNWTHEVYGDGFDVELHPSNDSIWYCTTYNSSGSRLRSTTGGRTWEIIDSLTDKQRLWRMPIELDRNNPNVLFSSSSNNMYKTVDGGTTWQQMNGFNNMTIIEVDRTNSNLVYATSTWNGGFLRSLDGGNTWSVISEPGPGGNISDIESKPGMPGHLYVTRGTFSNGLQVYYSSDSATTWTNITGDFPAIPANSIAPSPHDANDLYIGSDLGVYFSDDHGVTWSEYNDNLPNTVVADLHYYEADSTLRAGTHGRGYWVTKAAPPTVGVGIEDTKNTIQAKLYPNPAKNNVSLEVQSPHRVNEIQILDQLGQVVTTIPIIADTRVNATWNLTNSVGNKVANGIYFIQIKTTNKAIVKKLVVN